MAVRRQSRGFTLIEALVSIAILAGLLLTLATVFRQSSRMASRVRGGQAVFQAARQVFEALGRDLAGVTRDGFLFIRCQVLKLKGGSAPSGLVLYYDEEGGLSRVNKGRTDVLVMSVAGAHNSAVDATKTSSMSRVIWAQSERASGNNLAILPDTPKYWAKHFVLARHQTLMVPDAHSVDTAAGSYTGSNRGADFFNMSVSDLTRFFGPAMGSGDQPHNRVSGVTYGLFRYDELAP